MKEKELTDGERITILEKKIEELESRCTKTLTLLVITMAILTIHLIK
jgi:hypothetical protein